jgi:hypothetical protein
LKVGKIQLLELRDRFVASSDPAADLTVYWKLMILFEKTGEKYIAAVKLAVVQLAEVL